MTFLTNWIFWVIVVAIIIIMAIIGYLAEGTELDSKNKNKKENKQIKQPEDVEEISISEENNAPSAWTGEIKKDERHEQIHDVPSMDDWTTIPTDAIAPTVNEEEPTQDNNNQLFSEMTPDSTTPSVASIVEPSVNPQILENLDTPLNDSVIEPAVVDNVAENTLSNEPVTEEPLKLQVETPSPEPITLENHIEPSPIFSMPATETIEPVSNQPESLEIPETPKVESLEVLDAPVEKIETTEDIWK